LIRMFLQIVPEVTKPEEKHGTGAIKRQLSNSSTGEKTMALLLLTILLGLVPAQQEIFPDQSLKMWNGKNWAGISKAERQVFLVGFMQGLSVIAAGDEPCFEAQVSAKLSFYCRLSLGEMLNEVDSFYKEGANDTLPITVAIEYAAKKANGASVKELDEFLARTRKAAESSR
jgi:hypothetical protein